MPKRHARGNTRIFVRSLMISACSIMCLLISSGTVFAWSLADGNADWVGEENNFFKASCDTLTDAMSEYMVAVPDEPKKITELKSYTNTGVVVPVRFSNPSKDVGLIIHAIFLSRDGEPMRQATDVDRIKVKEGWLGIPTVKEFALYDKSGRIMEISNRSTVYLCVKELFQARNVDRHQCIALNEFKETDGSRTFYNRAVMIEFPIDSSRPPQLTDTCPEAFGSEAMVDVRLENRIRVCGHVAQYRRLKDGTAQRWYGGKTLWKNVGSIPGEVEEKNIPLVDEAIKQFEELDRKKGQ